MMTASSILITGADGFVGRHLVPFLSGKGHQLILTSQHTRPDRRMLLLNGAATDWGSVLDDVNIIIHLAGIAHRQGIDDNVHLDVTAESCRALVTALPQTRKLKKIIFLSTAKIWGETSGASSKGPITDQTPVTPPDGYARAKLAAEQILMAQEQVPVIALRPPLIYGAGVKANFARLMDLCAHGLPGGIPLPLASVNNRRNLLDIDALCHAISTIIDQPAPNHKSYGIADHDAWSTPALLCHLTSAMDGRLRLMSCPPVILSIVARLMGKQGLVDRLMGNFWMQCHDFSADYQWAPPRDSATAFRHLGHLFREKYF